MSDSNRRTLRTLVQGTVAVLLWLAVYLPSLLDELGVERDSWAGLGILLAILTAVTRLSQIGAFDQLLDLIGLGKQSDGRHEAP